MAGTEPAREPPVLKRMIEVIVGIIAAGIVSDPPAVGVNVGRIWMPRLVAKVANSSVMRSRALSRRSASLAASPSRPFRGVSASASAPATASASPSMTSSAP